eukprot:Gb_03553 [translate_table: standard]
MLIKVASLHKIAAKLEVFPCKDLFYKALRKCTLERGILSSPANNVAIVSGSVFLELYKMPQPNMVYNADSTKSFLKGKDIVKIVLRDWVVNPETFKRRAHLDYPISQFRRGIRIGMMLLNRLGKTSPWPPILWMHATPIWSPTIRYSLHGHTPEMLPFMCYMVRSMHKISEAVKNDLKLIAAWWCFKDSTIIWVEGTLTPPTALPLYVTNWLAALEVARQCGYGMARRCKTANQKPHPFHPFKIGDFYYQNWPSLERYVREVETMNLRGKGTMRYWDPYGKVKKHLESLHDKEVESRIRYAQEALDTSSQTHEEDVETEETYEVVKQKLLSGLPTRLLEVQLPSTSAIAMVSILAPSTASTSRLGVIGLSSEGLNIAITTPANLFSSSILSPSTTLVSTLSTISTSSPPSQSTSLTTKIVSTMSTASLPPPSSSTSSSNPFTTLPLDLSTEASIVLESSNPTSTIEGSTMLFALDPLMSLQSKVATPPAFSAQVMSKQQWIQMQLAQVERMDTPPPSYPEVTLEYDKSTSSLERVTKRRIKTGEQVTTLETEENLLSLTRKRKRGTKDAGMDDKESMADPVSIVRSANKMSEEVVERM